MQNIKRRRVKKSSSSKHFSSYLIVLFLLVLLSIVFVLTFSADSPPDIEGEEGMGVFPVNNSVGVSLYPTHNVTVSNSDGDFMNITFTRNLGSWGHINNGTGFINKFGYHFTPTEAGSDDINYTIIGTWFTCPADGSASKIIFYVYGSNNGSESIEIKCAIYNKSNYTLVGNTSQIIYTGTFPGGPDWFTCPLIEYTPIRAGEEYYVVVWANTAHTSAAIDIYGENVLGINRSIIISQPYNGTFPTNISNINPNNISYVQGRVYNIYVSYYADAIGNGSYYMDNFDVNAMDTIYSWEVNVSNVSSNNWVFENYTFRTLSNKTSVDTINPYKVTSPILDLTATGNESLSNVSLYYRYSDVNNTFNNGWCLWDNNSNPDTTYPWNWSFNFTNGTGYYEFYSIGNITGFDNETPPANADARCQYTWIIISNEVPSNGTTNVAIGISSLSAQINHSHGGLMNYTLSCWVTPYSYHNNTNGTYHLYLNGSLEYSTRYKWSILVWNRSGSNNDSNNETYYFITESQPSGNGNTPTPPPVETIEDDPPEILYVNQTPIIVTSSDNVTINATVTDDNTLESVMLFWNDGTDPESKDMTLASNDKYTAKIGPFEDGAKITYWVNATDNASQSTESDKYNFTVIDNSGPTILKINPEDKTYIYTQKPTIKATYEDPSGINIESIILNVDTEDKTNSNDTNITSNTISYTPSENMSNGNHYVILNISDSLGNTETKSWSFTIEEAESYSEVEVGNVTSGNETTVIPENAETTGVSNIVIIPNKDLTDVKVIVVELNNKPDGIPQIPIPTGIIYKYFDFSLFSNDIYIEENDLQSIIIKFQVEQEWIIDNNVSGKENVTLMRYHNSTWMNLTTTIIDEDDEFVYYEAKTEGLSTFAIVGEGIIKTDQGPDLPDIPWIVILGVIIVATIILIIVLFKAGYIYTDQERSIEKSKKNQKEKKK